MKRIAVFLTVLALALTIVTPVFAAGKGPANQNGQGNGFTTRSEQRSPRGTFAITGTIAEVGADYVKVNVLQANKLAQPYINGQITLTLSLETRYVMTDGTVSTIISLSDLEVGQPVSVNGTLANNVWSTLRITVGASLSCLQ